MLVFEQILLPQPILSKQIQLLKTIGASRLTKRPGNIAAFVATLVDDYYHLYPAMQFYPSYGFEVTKRCHSTPSKQFLKSFGSK